VFWTIAVALAIASGLSLTRADRPAGDTEHPVSVLIAERDLTAGTPLRGAVRLAPWPGAPPPDALLAPPDPDATAAADIAAGEPVLARRVGTTSGIAARIGTDRRGVYVPAPIGPVTDVTHVDLIGSADPVLGDGRTVVLARRAPVLAREPDALLVGLTHQQSLEVVGALTTGSVTVALSGAE
jgi:hypothetical protein